MTGAALPFAVNAGAFLVSSLRLTGLTSLSSERAVVTRNVSSSVRDGLSFLWKLLATTAAGWLLGGWTAPRLTSRLPSLLAHALGLGATFQPRKVAGSSTPDTVIAEHW